MATVAHSLRGLPRVVLVLSTPLSCHLSSYTTSSYHSILSMHQDSRHSMCLTHSGEAWMLKTMHCSIEHRFLCSWDVTMEHSSPAASTHDTVWSKIGRCTLVDVTWFFSQSALSDIAGKQPQSTHDRSTTYNQVNQHHAIHDPSPLDLLALHHPDYDGQLRRHVRPEWRSRSLFARHRRGLPEILGCRGPSLGPLVLGRWSASFLFWLSHVRAKSGWGRKP